MAESMSWRPRRFSNGAVCTELPPLCFATNCQSRASLSFRLLLSPFATLQWQHLGTDASRQVIARQSLSTVANRLQPLARNKRFKRVSSVMTAGTSPAARWPIVEGEIPLAAERETEFRQMCAQIGVWAREEAWQHASGLTPLTLAASRQWHPPQFFASITPVISFRVCHPQLLEGGSV